MLRDAWFIARKDLQFMAREPMTLLWVFVMPVVFTYFVGTITGAMSTPGQVPDRIVIEAPDDAGFLGDELARQLDRAGFKVERCTPEDPSKSTASRLTLPAGFSARALAGEKSVVRLLLREGGGPQQQLDRARVNRAVYTVVADLAASASLGDVPSSESFQTIAQMPRTLKVEVERAGKSRHIPSGFEQAVPGTLVWFTLSVLLSSGTATVVIERQLGVLSRLASTPIARSGVVLGKWFSRLALAWVQILAAVVAGTFLFHMDWGPELPMVLLVLFCWGAFCASLAMLFGSLATSEGQAVALGVISSMVLAMLGGCGPPIEITPRWFQALSKAIPTGWTMDAMHKLISFQSGALSVWPHVLALLAAAVVIGWLAARRFRFQ